MSSFKEKKTSVPAIEVAGRPVRDWSYWLPSGLAFLSAGLLWTGWPVHSAALALVLLVAWVPYLRLEQVLVRRGASGWKVFRYTYLVLWNAFTTYWVSFSTVGGGVAAVVLNALLMCLPTMAFYHTKRLLGPLLGYLSLPVYWIAFEQLHLHWDLTWPWLTLGNGFAEANQLVQWYEYTGFLGGSLWIWAVNILVFRASFGWPTRADAPRPAVLPTVSHLADDEQLAIEEQARAFLAPRPPARPERRVGPWLWATAVAAIPMALSVLIGVNVREKGAPAEVLVVQPNIDPFLEKFAGTPNFIPYDDQLTRLLTLTEQNMTPRTKLVFWPETALEETYWEQGLDADRKIGRIRGFLGQHPGLALVTGMTTVGSYPSKEKASPTARYRDDMGYYDVFNAAVLLPGPTGAPTFYHKSRLVPGAENVPPLLTKLVAHIDLGGYVGSYGSQEERTVFRTSYDSLLRVAPLICYESIYGDFVAQYVQNGATLLSIITNDGWWSDTPGHLQHLQYATLRAIETRRDVARAANTGISGFINQKGIVTQQTPWWVPAVSRATVHLNTEQTFYVRHGELLGPATQALAVLLLVLVVLRGVGGRRPRPALTK